MKILKLLDDKLIDFIIVVVNKFAVCTRAMGVMMNR